MDSPTLKAVTELYAEDSAEFPHMGFDEYYQIQGDAYAAWQIQDRGRSPTPPPINEVSPRSSNRSCLLPD